ncbi:MAG: 50S ribosomal protein L17 [Bacteroidia bacterium]|jgi:large subunit ribosomal protein L17
MRHGGKVNHLGRTSAHRKALLANLASSLIIHKRIFTTVAKAKELRKYVEPLLTKSKTDTTHNRRTVFAYVKNKDIVTTMFRDVAPKIANRPGGYTRIIKTGNRMGDNADMCMIELVDFNEIYSNAKVTAEPEKAKTTRRSRKPAGATADAATAPETTTEGGFNAKAATEAFGKKVKLDDLKIVEGIGPKIEELYVAAGISTWAQLAETSVEKSKEVLLTGGDRYKMHDPSTWAQQALLASEGKWAELKELQEKLDGGKE